MRANLTTAGQAPHAQEARDSRWRLPGWRTLAAVGALVLCGILIYRVAQAYSLAEVLAALREVPMHRIALAGLCAAGSYACLTLFDTLGLRYAGVRYPYPYVALTSFTSLSLGHTIGFAALSSGAVRYRFYARKGLTLEQLARLVGFCGTTVGLGLSLLGGVALLAGPSFAAEMLPIGRTATLAAGAVCLAIPTAYVGLCAFYRDTVHVWRWSFELPSLRLALGQCAIGALNYLLLAACLYQALAGLAEVDFAGVATAYAVANVAALISHVPGGYGVLEGIVLVLLPGASVVGALVIFRVTYYLVPLALGAVCFGLSELYFRAKG
ncbi:MAG: lysylphosphatidylglycerol synthase domain-containing protein [Alphaproteobacteria bacterium]